MNRKDDVPRCPTKKWRRNKSSSIFILGFKSFGEIHGESWISRWWFQIVFFCLTLIYLGQWSNWMFPMGWNHQLDIIWQHDVSERSWNIFEKANLLAFSVEISHFKIPSTQECMNVDLDAAEKTNKFDKFGSLWIYKTPQELEIYQPPKFDNSPLKNDALKTILLSFLGLSRPIARGKKNDPGLWFPTLPSPSPCSIKKNLLKKNPRPSERRSKLSPEEVTGFVWREQPCPRKTNMIRFHPIFFRRRWKNSYFDV